jgi:hypothetical protein
MAVNARWKLSLARGASCRVKITVASTIRRWMVFALHFLALCAIFASLALRPFFFFAVFLSFFARRVLSLPSVEHLAGFRWTSCFIAHCAVSRLCAQALLRSSSVHALLRIPPMWRGSISGGASGYSELNTSRARIPHGVDVGRAMVLLLRAGSDGICPGGWSRRVFPPYDCCRGNFNPLNPITRLNRRASMNAAVPSLLDLLTSSAMPSFILRRPHGIARRSNLVWTLPGRALS